MGLIYDTVTASNIAGYFNTSQLDVDSTLGERIFLHANNLVLNCLTSRVLQACGCLEASSIRH